MELEALQKIGPGATWFATSVNRVLEQSSDAPVTPALLSRVIWAARSTCPDKQAAALYASLFKALKKRYGKTEWSTWIPHWYSPGELRDLEAHEWMEHYDHELTTEGAMTGMFYP